MTKNHCTGP